MSFRCCFCGSREDLMFIGREPHCRDFLASCWPTYIKRCDDEDAAKKVRL